MGRVQTTLIASAAVLVSAAAASFAGSSAQAADYNPPCVPPPQCMAPTAPSMANPVPQCMNPPGPLCAMPAPPPPQPMPQPLPMMQYVEEFASGWYLRGDIGMTNQSVQSLFNISYNTALSVQPTGMGFDSSPLFGIGIGYQFNNWLRFDVTGQYRAKANFKGTDTAKFNDGGGTAILADNYTASKSEWLFLANAYFDIGTWWCITPYIGAGVGFARNTISSFRDDGIGFFSNGSPITSVAFGEEASMWNFAWALHAGLSYKATPGLSVDLGYSYVNLGDATSGDLVAFDGTNNVNNPMLFRGITSHDLKLGIRMQLDSTPAQPSYLQPQPSYVPAPQPVYQQPQLYLPPPQPTYQPQYQQPLMRRG